MKKFTLFSCGLLMAAVLLLSGCKKEIVPTVNNYISVNNATLVAKELPKASLATEMEIVMNEQVIPGGSAYVKVTSPMSAAKIIVGMKDQKGYYEAAPNAKGTDGYSFALLVNQNIKLNKNETGFIMLVALQDVNGNVSQMQEHFVQLRPITTGVLQVSLSFDNEKDVDLHLVEPEQKDQTGHDYSFSDRHVSYAHPVSRNGGKLILESNTGCIIDGLNNECIVYDENAYVAPGLYKVYVDMFTNCNTNDRPTHWVASVTYNGELIASQTGGNPVVGSFPSNAPDNYANLNNLQPVMTFIIPNK